MYPTACWRIPLRGIHMKFGKKEITRMADLTNKYFGDEVSVYFLQGAMYSCLSAATDELNPIEIFLNPKGHIPLITTELDLEEMMEFSVLLMDDVYQKCLELLDKHDDIIPMVSLDKFRGKYLPYTQLNEEEQNNLLDWYVGYFFIYQLYWKHELIQKHIASSNLEVEGKHIIDFFCDAVNTQHLVAYALNKRLNRSYKTPVLRDLLQYIDQFPAKFDAEYKSYILEDLAPMANSLLFSICVIAMDAFEPESPENGDLFA
jgi:hypothetical protein